MPSSSSAADTAVVAFAAFPPGPLPRLLGPSEPFPPGPFPPFPRLLGPSEPELGLKLGEQPLAPSSRGGRRPPPHAPPLHQAREREGVGIGVGVGVGVGVGIGIGIGIGIGWLPGRLPGCGAHQSALDARGENRAQRGELITVILRARREERACRLESALEPLLRTAVLRPCCGRVAAVAAGWWAALVRQCSAA